MKIITLPLHGITPENITLFLSDARNLAIYDESQKNGGGCRLKDGHHNNGGWHIAMTQIELVALLAGLFK